MVFTGRPVVMVDWFLSEMDIASLSPFRVL